MMTTSTWNRFWVGYCPQCGRLHVIEDAGGSWPPAVCECGWIGGLPELHEWKLYDPTERNTKKVGS